MEKYDFIKLIEDDEELRSKNIFKGYHGSLVSYISPTDEWIVMIYDPYYKGNYAVVKVKSSALKFSQSRSHSTIKEHIEFISRPDFYTHTALRPPKFREYDHVRLICDKPEYNSEGVHKGDDGCVMFSYAHGKRWDVLFSEHGTGEDIADIMVNEDDLELLGRPKDTTQST